ncbi:MAG: class I SAM-dependent methyltransferase [Candidatus Ranarchaeia archaeon]
MINDHYFTRYPKSKPDLGVIHTYFRGRIFEFVTASGVFSKKRIAFGTRLLVESMILPENGSVLDVGCGFGPVGIAAASFVPNINVFMTDVNERAVWLARKNKKRNNVKNVKVKRGFLYDPVKGMKFKIILSNPPITAGLKVVVPLLEKAPEYLVENGLLQIVVRTRIGGKTISKIMGDVFGNVDVHSRKGGYRVLLSKN